MRKIFPFVLILCFITIIIQCNTGCIEREQTKKDEEIGKRKSDDFVFLYYADSRGQPFSNWNQKRHRKFAEMMIKNENNKNIKNLVHVDAYRVDNYQELENIGLEEYFDKKNIIAIEWGNKFLKNYPIKVKRMKFGIKDKQRIISF